MPASLTKEEQVMFQNVVANLDDMLIIGKAAATLTDLSPQEAANARDKIWLPAPMYGVTYDGIDQTANFGEVTQLNVPVSVGIHKSAPIKFGAYDRRSAFAWKQWEKGAKQKLASDINMAIMQRVALQGATFSRRTSAATGYDDVADLDNRFTRIGVRQDERVAFYSTASMNAMAGNLASRSEDSRRSRDAYEKAMVNSDIAGFEVFKNDLTLRLTPATGGATTINGANQRTIPAATTVASTGEEENKDNRFTDLVVTAATYANIKPGDAFTIANVNEVHGVTKQDTGQLQTFRVIATQAQGGMPANTIRVYPAIIAGGATRAEIEYQTVSAVPANGAALTWLNTTTAEMNPFFRRENLVLLPGSYTVDPSEGWNAAATATTELGLAISYVRQGEINDLSAKARFDVRFGTGLLDPRQAGVQVFSQA